MAASIVVSPSIGRTGNILYFSFADPSGANPQRVTAISSAPVVTQNGSAVALPPPTWADTGVYGGQIGLIAYKMPATGQASDAWTYSAASGWATANGQPAPAATNVPIANYTGMSLEPEYAVPSMTMPLGYNVNWPSGQNFNNYHVFANLIHCFETTHPNVVTMTADGHPLTVSGPVTATLWFTSQPNGVDAKGFPIPTGTYTLRLDESNPANPYTVKLSINNNPQSPTITPGIVTGGVEVGKLFSWKIARTLPANWFLNFQLIFTPPTKGTVPWTLSNEVLLRPSDSLADYKSTNQPASTVVNWLKSSYCNRHADSMLGIDGISSMVDANDSPAADAFSYGVYTTAIPIGSIQPYSLATSPNIYLSDSYGGIATASPPGSPGPYMVSPANLAFLSRLGGSYACYEVATAISHGLKALQLPTAPGTLGGVQLNSGGANYTSPNLNGNAQVVWPTAPDRLVTFAYVGVAGGGAFGNAASSQAASGNYQLSVPDRGIVPIETVTALGNATGSHAWINVPIASSIGWSTDAATRVLNTKKPGGKVYVELGNEVWSSSPQGANMAAAMAALLGLANYQTFYVLRAKQVHAEWVRVFTAAGRGSEIVRVISSQWGNPGVTTGLVAQMNAQQVPCDVLAIGTYFDCSTSASMAAAASSWAVADLVDLQRHQLWMNALIRGSSSMFASHNAALAKYSVADVPTPKLCGYEGSCEQLVNSTSGALVHDCNYHPNIFDLENTYLYLNQLGGMQFLNYYCLCMYRPSGNCWADYASELQVAGTGTGSDGLAVNQFATTQGGSPADGLSHDGPDAVNPLGNVSPKALANRLWMAAANPALPMPTATIRFFSGLRRK